MAKVVIDGVEYAPKYESERESGRTHKCPSHGIENCTEDYYRGWKYCAGSVNPFDNRPNHMCRQRDPYYTIRWD